MREVLVEAYILLQLWISQNQVWSTHTVFIDFIRQLIVIEVQSDNNDNTWMGAWLLSSIKVGKKTYSTPSHSISCILRHFLLKQCLHLKLNTSCFIWLHHSMKLRYLRRLVHNFFTHFPKIQTYVPTKLTNQQVKGLKR